MTKYSYYYRSSDRKTKVYSQRKSLTSKQLLRFDGPNVDFLANEFLQVGAPEKRGGALSPRRQMELFLRYVGGQSYQEQVAYDTGTHRTTVCKTLKNVLNKIVKGAKHWMKFPSTLDEIATSRAEWAASGRLSGAVGAVDCMRIRIKCPARECIFLDPDKDYASLNVMATCDANARFTSIEANWPGLTHDADVWINSSVRKIMSKLNAPAWLLGDASFDICPWLITPFGGFNLNEEQEKFNAKHKIDSEVIQTAMLQLLARFPILDPVTSSIQLSYKKIPKLLVSCAVLHNMSKHLNDDCEFGGLSDTSEQEQLRDRFFAEDLVTHYRGLTIRNDLLRDVEC